MVGLDYQILQIYDLFLEIGKGPLYFVGLLLFVSHPPGWLKDYSRMKIRINIFDILQSMTCIFFVGEMFSMHKWLAGPYYFVSGN